MSAFEKAVRTAYPLHYFLLDDHSLKVLRVMYDAGLEKAAEIADSTVACPWHSAKPTCAPAAVAIRNEKGVSNA